MDYNKFKVFGFPRAMTKFKIYNPAKVKYMVSKDHGYFEAPKHSKNRELRHLFAKYKQREEYEKYLNPKGFKYAMTSNFPKQADSIDYPNIKCYLVRSGKEYTENQVKFLVDPRLSKPEIRQFVQKLYNVKVNKVETAILPGEVKLKASKKGRSYYRTRDRKKAVLSLDIKVDDSLRKI